MVGLSLVYAYGRYRNKPSLSQYLVSKIHLCKVKKTPYHEFVLLEVHHPSASTPSGYLFVDRTRPHEGLPTRRMATALLNLIPSKGAALIPQLSSSSPKSGTSPHYDRIMVVDKIDGLNKQLYDIVFSFAPRVESIFLHTVLAAASVIQGHVLNYSLRRDEYYLYAPVFCLLLIDETEWPEHAFVVQRDHFKDGKGHRVQGFVKPDLVRRAAQLLQPSLWDEVQRIRKMKPDAELEQAMEVALAEERKALEEFQALQQRMSVLPADMYSSALAAATASTLDLLRHTSRI